MEEEEGEASKLEQSGSSPAESGEPGTSASSGRFYECIFCRRGFTTAQALGGHMNIHRRDRPRVRPPAVSPKDSFHPYSRNPPPSQIPDPSSASNCIVYFPPPSSSPEARPELLRAGEELHLGPSAPRQVGNGLHDEEDLDLELRLGHRIASHESSE